jgi:hypothetical protein
MGHLHNRPPAMPPHELHHVLEQMSKSDLIDLAWSWSNLINDEGECAPDGVKLATIMNEHAALCAATERQAPVFKFYLIDSRADHSIDIVNELTRLESGAKYRRIDKTKGSRR